MKKRRMSIGLRISVVFFLVIVVVLLVMLIGPLLVKKSVLPVLGMPGHTVGTFRLVDQDGDTITDKEVDGKIRVAEFFFTTCKGICPIMGHNLQEVNSVFSRDTNVVILSHTVNPGYDSVPVLRDYARSLGGVAGKWYFFTGTKEALYQLALHGYLLNTDPISNVPADTSFFHSPTVTLVDKQGRIRGFYDATDKKEVSKLIKDIRKLQ